MARRSKKGSSASTVTPLTVAMRAYIDRIGAEQLTFRSFMIKHYTPDHKGNSYYIERAYITINEQGDIALRGNDILPEWHPTEQEKESIKKEYADIKFPVAVNQTLKEADSYRLKQNVPKELWYSLVDQKNRKDVIMCVQRVNKDDGGKYYVPHTFFSDGNWRKLEPSVGGKLPFWKPSTARNKIYIMLHEGLPAARYVDWMINSDDVEAEEARKKHPWTDYLKLFEHWGIHGGALAPQRADYSELWAAKPQKLVYVCDRDDPGERALMQVSKLYREKLFGLRCDKVWRENWDLKDPLPTDFYENDYYTGPTAESLLRAATWATDVVRPPKEKSYVKMRIEFSRQWFHIVKPEVYVHVDFPNHTYSREEFNNKNQPFSDQKDGLHYLMQKEESQKADVLMYDPSRPDGYVAATPNGFNCYTGSSIKAVKGDVGPWLEYIDKIYPVPGDQTEILRWCATLIARPDIKMEYALLLCSSKQGVGKTTLGTAVLAPLIGMHNTSFPSEIDICESRFSHWKHNVRLAVVSEIYQGHSFKAYNILKETITDRDISIHLKYQAPYRIDNWIHIIACSNSLRALKLPSDDRRWFVPKVTEKVSPKIYWINFRTWLKNGGLGFIKHWAHEWGKKNEYVTPGDRAPQNAAKLAMIRAGFSAGELLVADWLDKTREQAEAEKKVVVVTDLALRELVTDVLFGGRHNEKLVHLMTIRRVAEGLNWSISPDRVNLGTGENKAHLMSTDPETVNLTPAKIRANGLEIITKIPNF